ncbi:MAG: hypothetical protein JW828_13795 [Sedimentisphaerales bacterium]|nr:hypothetical protein [Sedimentisphaerales bacterium]
MLLIPYELDLAFARRPIINWLLVGSMPRKFAGRIGKCPKCRKRIVIPDVT